VYLDGVNVTGRVKYAPGVFANPWQQVKIVSFPEPVYSTVLAFKGSAPVGGGGPQNSGLMLRCSSTRSGSPWSFTSSVTYNWTSVRSNSSSADSFPVDWFAPSFSGPQFSAVPSNASFSLGTTETCNPVTAAEKIATNWTDTFFTFRKAITQNCGNIANPSVSPSLSSPSLHPISLLRPSLSPSFSTARPSKHPSQSPSRSPSSSHPSTSPTTGQPSRQPLSSRPSTTPSKSPAVSRPSKSPSRPTSGTTTAPTTCVGEVVCCVRV